MKLLFAPLFSWQLACLVALAAQIPSAVAASSDGVTYTNFTKKGPVEIHVIRIPRKATGLEIQSIHSAGKPVGLAPVTEQLKTVEGTALAAINGDFYQREGAFAGDPRGLQIVDGDLVSAPMNSSSFWIDAAGEPHMANTQSGLRITWPDGSTAAIGLNGRCDPTEIELYTPSLGAVPRGNSGREIVLHPLGGETNGFRPAKEYSMRALEIRGATNAPIAPGTYLLALGGAAAKTAPKLEKGAIVKISTVTTPNLRGVRTAISGGPILVNARKARRFDKPEGDSHQYTSMMEKHPRSAIGWNANEYVWVEVDGRHQSSVGMTLGELGTLMVELGCDEAMNLDGGGSATLWYDGKVRNRPCDGFERPVANSLVLVRRAQAATK
ncbi:MAG TPA: phosphodiester glycosidase family protein [Verrucomicrobiae bacterium]|nr:phosphodiester glycosidase family protein [Verrucomicrobiae bacterium]